MADWSIPLDALARKTNVALEKVVRQVTLELFNRVVLRSPVDTGRFRANWNVSYASIDTAVEGDGSEKGANSWPSKRGKLFQVQAATLAAPVGGIVYMCNSLPYARVLEYGEYPNPAKFGSKKRGETEMTIHTEGGYSIQAPSGMVRVTALEITQAVRKAVAP